MFPIQNNPKGGREMKHKTTTTLVSAACLGLLAACNTVKVHSWTAPGSNGRPLGKTMVLGVAESDSLSLQYESLFVERLGELGISAESLHARVQKTDKITEEALAAALREQGFNSILVTRLLSEKERQQVVNTGFYPSHYDSYYGFYSHAYHLTYNTAYVQSFVEFELETNLYDVETSKLVWSGRKVIYDDRSDQTNMRGIINGVIKDLRKQGMIE
jgi:hypothetical protein